MPRAAERHPAPEVTPACDSYLDSAPTDSYTGIVTLTMACAAAGPVMEGRPGSAERSRAPGPRPGPPR
jgi:hypothetical protein